MKKYRVNITEITDDREKVLLDEDYESVSMLGMSVDKKMIGEILINEGIVDLAFKIAQSHKIIKAAELAVAFKELRDEIKSDKESELIDKILKGE